MALDRLDQLRSRERRWRSSGDLGRPRGPRRSVAAALVLASVSLMTLDQQTDPVIEPARRALGEVIGPVEVGASAVLRPFLSLPGWFRTHGDLRGEIDTLEAENSRLRGEVSTSGYDRNRLAEYDGLTRAASDLGYTLVPARVVALGPSQSFSSTVMIDAGSEAGLSADMTVMNNDGLVGRVLRVTRTTATVLLAIDPESVVGGRIGSSMEIGFLHGRGALGDDARLDLQLLDQALVPDRGDAVVTWGSRNGAPYVSGIPVGEVTAVYSNVRDSSQRAVVRPYVDYASLDVVGVVVPSGADSDRALIEAEGGLR